MRSSAVVLAILWAVPALSQVDPAADHYRAGVTHFRAGEYPAAIQEFRAADGLRPSPVLSFNIAQCFEKMADLASARAAYQEYLRRAPSADDRPAIEATVASIDQKLAQQQAQQDTVVLVPATPSAEVAAPSRRGPNYAFAVTTGSVGVAALVAGIVLNVLSHNNSDDLQNSGRMAYLTHAQAQNYHDNAQNFWTGAIIGYAVGGALLATGVTIGIVQAASTPAHP